MKEKAFKLEDIIIFLMIIFVLIVIIELCYKALRNVIQHQGAPLLVIAIVVMIFCVQVQMEKQRIIEREKQREIEREKQREIERQKQREIERQKQREIERQKQREIERQKQREIERQKQKVQELLNVICFILFIVTVIVLLYKGICYLLTPNYNTLEQNQFQMNMHIQRTLQRPQEMQERLNNDILLARLKRQLAYECEWQAESYQNDYSQEASSVNWRKKYLIKNQNTDEPPPRFRNRQLALSSTFKPNFFLEELNFREHQFVEKSFSNKSFSYVFKIDQIKKIHNEQLLNNYNKQKQKYYNIYGGEMQERYLFHGTVRKVLDSICTNNFDLTKVTSGLYGWGISFANNPFYASHYSTKYCNDENYVMILARVLMGKKQVGYAGQKYPDEGFDTTTNDDGQVLVKYDEDTFYPEFIVYFSPIFSD